MAVSVENIKRLTKFFMEKTAASTPEIEWGAISVMLTDDSLISEINASYLNRANATDVISFELGPETAGAGNTRNAEIIVNAERAVYTGVKYKGAVDELALYIAHACDHLSGADDGTAPARRKMRARELRWIKEAKASGMLDNLIVKQQKKT